MLTFEQYKKLKKDDKNLAEVQDFIRIFDDQMQYFEDGFQTSLLNAQGASDMTYDQDEVDTRQKKYEEWQVRRKEIYTALNALYLNPSDTMTEAEFNKHSKTVQDKLLPILTFREHSGYSVYDQFYLGVKKELVDADKTAGGTGLIPPAKIFDKAEQMVKATIAFCLDPNANSGGMELLPDIKQSSEAFINDMYDCDLAKDIRGNFQKELEKDNDGVIRNFDSDEYYDFEQYSKRVGMHISESLVSLQDNEATLNELGFAENDKAMLQEFSNTLSDLTCGGGISDNGNTRLAWLKFKNEILPKVSQPKAGTNMSWLQWMSNSAASRGYGLPAEYNALWETMDKTYHLPIRSAVEDESLVYTGMAGRMISSYRNKGQDARDMDNLIKDLTAEIKNLRVNPPNPQTPYYNVITGSLGETLIYYAKFIQTIAQDPRMQDKNFREHSGAMLATRAVLNFNNTLKKLENRCPELLAEDTTLGRFRISWRKAKYEIKRNNAKNKPRTWESYISFHTGENADGREKEYLAKAYGAYLMSKAKKPVSFSVSEARRQAKIIQNKPGYQALLKAPKLMNQVLVGRRFDIMDTLMKNPYSYASEPRKLKAALLKLANIARDSETKTATPNRLPKLGSAQQMELSQTLLKLARTSDEKLNALPVDQVSQILSGISEQAISLLENPNNTLIGDGEVATAAAINAMLALKDASVYGRELFAGMKNTINQKCVEAGMKEFKEEDFSLAKVEEMAKNHGKVALEVSNALLRGQENRQKTNDHLAENSPNQGKEVFNGNLAGFLKSGKNNVEKLPQIGQATPKGFVPVDTVIKNFAQISGTPSELDTMRLVSALRAIPYRNEKNQIMVNTFQMEKLCDQKSDNASLMRTVNVLQAQPKYLNQLKNALKKGKDLSSSLTSAVKSAQAAQDKLSRSKQAGKTAAKETTKQTAPKTNSQPNADTQPKVEAPQINAPGK